MTMPFLFVTDFLLFHCSAIEITVHALRTLPCNALDKNGYTRKAEPGTKREERATRLAMNEGDNRTTTGPL